jgi:hypothetical protein
VNTPAELIDKPVPASDVDDGAIVYVTVVTLDTYCDTPKLELRACVNADGTPSHTGTCDVTTKLNSGLFDTPPNKSFALTCTPLVVPTAAPLVAEKMPAVLSVTPDGRVAPIDVNCGTNPRGLVQFTAILTELPAMTVFVPGFVQTGGGTIPPPAPSEGRT